MEKSLKLTPAEGRSRCSAEVRVETEVQTVQYSPATVAQWSSASHLSKESNTAVGIILTTAHNGCLDKRLDECELPDSSPGRRKIAD